MFESRRSTKEGGSSKGIIEWVDPNELFLEIVIGGTGKEAALQHRQDPGIAQSSTIKILFVDTDDAELGDISQEDKFLLTDYAAARHLQELVNAPERFPHQELVPHVKNYHTALGRAKDISTGLMTNRILGRPLLDYYATRSFSALAAFFLMPVRKLHAYANEVCVQNFQGNVQDRMRLTVCFVASICGGTGSSVGQLSHHLVDFLLLHQGGFTHCELEADLFLPGALEPKAQNPDLLRANAQAVLKENRKAMMEVLPTYQLGTVTLKRDLPLRFLYLFDNINVLGQVLETRQQVTQMRNATWDLRCRGVSGQEYRSRVVDIHLKEPAIYSAAGAAKLIYDVDHVLTVMGYRTGKATTQTLIQPLPLETTAPLVTQWWNRMERSFPELAAVPAYQKSVAGSPIKMALREVIDEQPRTRVGVAVTQTVRRAQNEWEKVFTELKHHTVAAREQLLTQQVMELLNRPGGFDVAKGVLDKLRTTYRRQHAELQNQYDLRRLPHDRIRERLQQIPTHWWQRWTWNPRGAYAKSYQRYVDSLLDLTRLRAQVETLAQLLEVVDHLENQRQQLLATLSGLTERLKEDFRTYLRHYKLHQNVAVHSVICDDELMRWYEAGAEQARSQMLEGLKIIWFEEEGELGLERHTKGVTTEGKVAILSEEGVARHLEHAQLPWQHVRNVSVEQLLTGRGTKASAVFAELARWSAPWISLNDVKVVPASHQLMILTSQTSEFFHEVSTHPGLSIKATGNPYEVTMLTTWHGIDPLEHLTKSEDHERAYQQAIAAGRALHLFPEDFEEDVNGAENPLAAVDTIPF